MTDTRKDFEEWYLKEYGNYISEYFINDRYLHEMVHMQYMGWQACQSLNDKRIQQLLAVIAVKDDAINGLLNSVENGTWCYESSECGDDGTYIGNAVSQDSDEVKNAESALAIKPENVELVASK